MRATWVGLATSLALVAGGVRGEHRVGAAVLTLPMSVRQMGMGNVSLGGRDVLRAWTNPALLADQETAGEAALNGASLFEGQQTTGGLGAGWRLGPRWVVGGLLTYYTLSTPEVDVFGNQLAGEVSQNTIAAGVTTALRERWLRFGMTLKVVSEKVVYERAAAGALDIGLIASWADLTGGLSGRNLGQKLRKGDDAGRVSESLPAEVRAGVSYAVRSLDLSVGGEYSKVANRTGRAGVGVEWWPARQFGLRVGASGVGEDLLQLSAGLSGIYQSVGLDYALGTHPLGPSHRVSLSYAFERAGSEGGVHAPGRRQRRPSITLKAEEDLPAGFELPAEATVDVDKEYEEARVLYAAGDYDASMKKANEVLQVDPQHWRAWGILGNSHYHKGDVKAAVTAYDRSLELHPDNPQLREWVEKIRGQSQ